MSWSMIVLKVLEFGIGKGINYLLEHPKIGIGNKLAKMLVNAVAKSKANDTTEDMFEKAVEVLV